MMPTWEEYQSTKKYVEEKALGLMSHESKDLAKVGFPINVYLKFEIGERKFYVIQANVFKAMIDAIYMKAFMEYPQKFGTGDAIDVIEALYNVEPMSDLEWFIGFLQREEFAYVIEGVGLEIIDKILRIDLFRKLDINETGQMEFTGGLFHALKHFSIGGKNLSTGKDVHDIAHPIEVLILAIRAFFISEGRFETSTKLISTIELDDKYVLKFVFYLEEKTGVYFIRTIHKRRK